MELLTDGIDCDLASSGSGASPVSKGVRPGEVLICVSCQRCVGHCNCLFGGTFVPGHRGICIEHMFRDTSGETCGNPFLAAKPLLVGRLAQVLARNRMEAKQ